MKKIKATFTLLASLLLVLPAFPCSAIAKEASTANLTSRDTERIKPIKDEGEKDTAGSVSYQEDKYSISEEDARANSFVGDEEGTSGDCTWTYVSSTGVLTVTGMNTGTNNFPWEDDGSPFCANNPIRQSVKQVIFSNNVVVSTAANMFLDDHELVSIDFSGLNFTDDVTSLAGMFYKAHAIKEIDLSNKNLSHVTNLEATFACNFSEISPDTHSHLETINLENTGLSSVTTAENTFFGCVVLQTLKISPSQTGKVFCPKSLNGFLQRCFLLPSFDCSLIDTTNTTNMDNTFAGLYQVTSLDLSTWDTSKVATMAYMFNDCRRLTEIKGLEKFNTSKVIDMAGMFGHCMSMTSLDVRNFDMSKVESIEFMFNHMSACHTIHAEGWNLPALQTMESAFMEDYVLENLDLSSWDVSNVKDMNSLFYYCESLQNPHIENWTPKSVTDITYFFYLNVLDPALLKIFSISPLEDISALFSESSFETLDLSPLAGKK